MSKPRATLAEVMSRSRYLLFDFDGPICGTFAGLPAPSIAAHLRELVTQRGIEIPTTVEAACDPFDVLRFAAGIAARCATEDVPWVRLSSVHGPQQVLLEGLAQAMPLFVAPDDGALIARVRIDHYTQLVRAELHLAINAGTPVEECVRHARQRPSSGSPTASGVTGVGTLLVRHWPAPAPATPTRPPRWGPLPCRWRSRPGPAASLTSLRTRATRWRSGGASPRWPSSATA